MAAHLLPTCDTTVTAIVTAIDTTTYVGDPNVHTQIIASDQFDAEVQASERGKVAAGMAVHQMPEAEKEKEAEKEADDGGDNGGNDGGDNGGNDAG